MDHRKVPLEVLREFVRSQTELSSIRLVAEDAGVSRSTVHKFINAGTTPHPRVRRLLALWYLRQVSGFDEMELIRPYVSALEILCGEVPEPTRGPTMLAVMADVEHAYTQSEEEAPRWVKILRTRLARAYDPAALIFQ